MIERLILIQSIETVRCLEEKVCARRIDADVGAILGWGYPPFRGGPIGWIHTLGRRRPSPPASAWRKMRAAFRAPTEILRDKAAEGSQFFPIYVHNRRAEIAKDCFASGTVWPKESERGCCSSCN
jgi:3-hydroxyacyl-CoA dehydrogenase/enoyl-CoA hydratase/3-hydroxybutyryl-CoA epimerase